MTRKAAAAVQEFRSPGTIIGRFVARQSIRSATFVALVFGAYVAAKAVGYAVAYPSVQGRAALGNSLGSNAGLDAILGAPRHLATLTGFTVWNTLGVMTIFGSIWALMKATKTFRGEEDNGRWELLLSGQTTARRATVNALAGLVFILVVLYVIVAGAFTAVGAIHKVDFSPSAGCFFALAAVASAVEFTAIGALCSQLMPTRGRAAGLAAGIFGASFLIRAMADSTNTPWLLNVTPLGWIEKLQPLYGPQPIWLLPIIGLTLIVSGFTIYLAGRRDLGDSIFADRDTARPHTRLLNTPFQAAIRLQRGSIAVWLVGITFMGGFFGLLTKSAANALSGADEKGRLLQRFSHSAHVANATAFLGVVFLILMIFLMCYMASTMGRVREDEAEGYIDNLLVRPVSRLRWLGGRLLLIVLVLALAALVASLAVWVGEGSQHTGVALSQILQGGANLLAPALFTLGAATLAFGFAPRATTLVGYGVVGWSFLIEILGSGLNLNHWFTDTSVLQHVALAPAAPARWGAATILAILGLVMGVLGAWAFTRRDLAAE